MKKEITQIQKKIVSLLRKYGKGTLSELSQDHCSEISRLAAFWLSAKMPDAKFSILKGAGITKGDKHDVLLIQTSREFWLADPTIWQFFPRKRSIYLGKFDNLEEAKTFLGKTYGGRWKVSEEMDKKSFREKNEWQRIIKENLKDTNGTT